MADPTSISPTDVTVLTWVIPRPTGRWHQAIMVTSRHVWVMPEVTFAESELMTAAAAQGIDEFHDFVRNSGWTKRPERCDLADVAGVQWNPTTGWMRIAVEGAEMIGAMIPDRAAGDRIKPLLKQAIGLRLRASKRPD